MEIPKIPGNTEDNTEDSGIPDSEKYRGTNTEDLVDTEDNTEEGIPDIIPKTIPKIIPKITPKIIPKIISSIYRR